MYFFNRRPRGFHYTFRYSSERRDILDELRRGVPPSDVARESLRNVSEDSRRSGVSRLRPSAFSRWMIVLVSLLLIAIAAVAVM